jgi:hypothetical protein
MCIQSLNGVIEVTAHNRPSDIHIITHKGSSINFITDVQLISKVKNVKQLSPHNESQHIQKGIK